MRTRAALCVGLAALAVTVVACGGGGSPAAKPTAADPGIIDQDKFPAGSRVKLRHPDRPDTDVPVATSADMLDRAVKWGVEKNQKAIAAALARGDLLNVTPGTAGEVEDNGLYWVRVRLAAGTYAGLSVYVMREWLASAARD